MNICNPAQVSVTAAIGDPSGATTSVFLVSSGKITVAPPALVGQKLRAISLFNRSPTQPVYVFFGSNNEYAYEIAPKGLLTIRYLGLMALSSQNEGASVSVTIFSFSG